MAELRLGSLVVMPQVRPGPNPELEHLAADIQANGLLNPVDVTLLTSTELSAYIEFVNRTWGSEVSLADYAHHRRQDGMYPLLIAGHSRVAALKMLQESDPANREYWVMTKVHDAHTPMRILLIQLGENTHRQPPQERRAMAVVELFRYGFDQGEWHNQAEFVRAMDGHISDRVVREAIGFARLPADARDFVFSGHLQYNAAVALGQASDAILQYVTARAGYYRARGEMPGEDLATAFRHEVALMIAHICNERLNGPAARKYIEGQERTMNDYVARIQAEQTGGLQPQLLFALDPPEVQTRLYMQGLERRLSIAIADMAHRSIESTTTAATMLRALGSAERVRQVELENARRRVYLGHLATDDH